jgi:hypothetical protein
LDQVLDKLAKAQIQLLLELVLEQLAKQPIPLSLMLVDRF